MSFSFYNSIVEFTNMILEQVSKYHIQFQFAQKGAPTKTLELIKDLTKEEYSKIIDARKKYIGSASSRTSSTYFVRPAEPNESIDKELYKLTYKTKRKEYKEKEGEPSKKDIEDKKEWHQEPIIDFCYITKENYRTIIDTAYRLNIEEDTFKIEPIEFEDLLILLKKEVVGKQYGNKLRTKDDVLEILKKFQMDIASKKSKQKKKGSIEQEKEDTKSSLDSVVKQSEELFKSFDNETKEKAEGFFEIDKNERTFKNMLDAHYGAKLVTKSATERELAAKKRENAINTLIAAISKYSSDPQVKNAIVEYVLYVRIHYKYPQYKSLFKSIYQAYSENEISTSDIDTFTKEYEKDKEKNKKKVSTRKKIETGKEKYIISSYDDDEKLVKVTMDLTPEEYAVISKKAEENKQTYEKDKKEFDAWYFSKDPEVSSSAPPIVKSPASYGVIGIVKKGGVQEMSATGTGAAVSPGEGEGVATKYAFAGAGGTKAKRKKGIVQSNSAKIIKADESYRIKNDAKSIFWESVRWLINNK